MTTLSSLFVWALIFVGSLFILVRASGYFTESAEKVGVVFGIPPFIVGVTIVALGTSLPELVSSIVAVLAGSSEIVVGNVIGSNATNILLVLGISAVVGKKLETTYEMIHVDLPLFVASAFLLAVTVWDGVFTLPEALLCMTTFVVYLLYASQVERGLESPEEAEGNEQSGEETGEGRKLERRTLVVLVVSALFIYIGARYTVESIIKLSEAFSIGTEIIAASAVALGTSLPELMVSVTAARSGNQEIAIGNILGSNIFNASAVMGIPALFGTLVIPESILLTYSLPIMLLATLLYVLITQDKQITKWEGWLLIAFYVLFIGKLFELF